MKKAIAITLALVMVALFAGCGLKSQLAGTTWEQVQKNGLSKVVITLSFEKGNEFNFDVKAYYDGELVSDDSFTNTGKWTVDGDILTLKYDGGLEDDVYRVEIDGDTLKLFDPDDDSYYYPFTRVEK